MKKGEHDNFIDWINQYTELCKKVDSDANIDNNVATNTNIPTTNPCIPSTGNYQSTPNNHTYNSNYQYPNIELSEKDSQKLHYKRELARIRVMEKLSLAQGLSNIKINEKIALNNEELRFKHKSHANIQPQQYSPEQTPNPIIETSIEPKNVFKEFINTYSVFKSEEKKYHYYIWNESSHRHINIDLHELKDDYLNYLEKKFQSDNLSLYINNFMDLLRLIPRQEDAHIHPLPPYSVMFKNGILDVKNFHFTELRVDEAKRYYNSLCIDLDYNENIPSPIYFDKLLNDISNNSINIENLICEQFGAAICVNNPEKKIFIYQGCTNAGKTRLMNILKKILPNNDSVFLDSITKLGDIDTSVPYRFIHILELGENSLRDEKVSLMKGLADGYQTSNNNPFKIFISTNHAIVTSGDGYIEPALKNRLSVVPFTHPMKNEDDDVKNFENRHLDNERLAIIVKCLKAYSHALKMGSFSKDDELNIHIDNADKFFNTTSSYLPSTANETCILTPKPTIQQILHDNFTLTDKPNPRMTTETIMQIINDIAHEELISEKSWVGRKLKQAFGKDRISSNRDNGNSPTYYNLEKKERLS